MHARCMYAWPLSLLMGDPSDKLQSNMKSTTSTSPKHLKKVLCLTPPALLTIFFYLHLETLTLLFTVQCASQPAFSPTSVIERLRASATYLPLKDTREGAETWFIST